MQNASYGLILSQPIVHYFQMEQIVANCDGNVSWTKWRNSWR